MNLFFRNITHTRTRAFTLLEVLASLSIVTLVILGPLTSAINSASYSRQTKDVMTATYLAEEALELLHYQYDTLFLACTNTPDAVNACGAAQVGNETATEKAWRLFKQRLHRSSGASCFVAPGCSYDFLDMLKVTSVDPIIYSPTTGIDCPKLSMVNSVVSGFNTNVRNYYVCSGISLINDIRLKDNAFGISKTAYSRSVFIKSARTFEAMPTPITSPANLELYYDDLIVTATVSFRRSNGLMRSIKVTDFFHARS